MAREPLTHGALGPSALVEQITSGAVTFPTGFAGTKGRAHDTSFTTTRNTVYRDKKISVRTTYQIEIDDKPLTVHIMVFDDGTVHCHGLPNHAFSSALDMTRAIIDASFRINNLIDEIGASRDSHHGGHR